jgi:shikimate kinase
MIRASNLVLVGPMGAGKSSVGRRLAGRLGLRFVDADRLLEETTGATVPVIFECEGEAGFRAREAALLAEVCTGRGQLIATGGGAVIDPANRALLQAQGFVVWLRVGVEQQLKRLARDTTRPLLAGGDRRARLEALAIARDPLYAEVADLVLDCDGLTVSVAVERIANAARQHWRPEAAA